MSHGTVGLGDVFLAFFVVEICYKSTWILVTILPTVNLIDNPLFPTINECRGVFALFSVLLSFRSLLHIRLRGSHNQFDEFNNRQNGCSKFL